VIDDAPVQLPKKKTGHMKRLTKMSKQYWKYAVVGSIGAVGSGCLLPAFAAILGQIVALYFDGDKINMKKEIAKYCLFMIGIAVASPITFTIQYWNLTILGEKLVKQVRERMLSGKQQAYRILLARVYSSHKIRALYFL
jgi:ATP-binding cassette subfamily B (MDR/TAP) protein 1